MAFRYSDITVATYQYTYLCERTGVMHKKGKPLTLAKWLRRFDQMLADGWAPGEYDLFVDTRIPERTVEEFYNDPLCGLVPRGFILGRASFTVEIK
jgi:hypothetical protein